MKKVLLILTIITTISFVTHTSTISAETNSLKDRDTTIDGIVYGDQISKIDSKENFNATLNIKNLFVKQGNIHVNLDIQYEGKTKKYNSSGKVFPSENLYLGGYIVDLKDTEDFQLISFKVEEDAKKALLLPVNASLSGKNVVKIAMVDQKSKDLIYFEGELPEEINMDTFKVVSENPTISSEGSKEALEKRKEKNSGMETWYWDFLDTEQEQIMPQSTDVKKIGTNQSLQSDDRFIPLMNNFYYEINGDLLSTYRDSGGYYKNTVTYPVGSENHLTKALQWAWIHNAPETFDPTDERKWAVSALTLTHQGQFLFIDETNEVVLFHEKAHYRITNPSIEVGLYDGNTEIISSVIRDAQFTDEDLKADLLSLAGLFPFVNSGFITILNSLNYVEQKHIANRIDYSDSIRNQEEIYGGETIRGFSYKLNNSFKDIEDSLNLSVLVQVPTDDHYIRVPGERDIEIDFEFDIYGRNAFGFYTEKVESVVKRIDKKYIVQ